MNESILTQLKITVERVVRPVRSSTYRKRKMREEMLAHLCGVFEEEARAGNDETALSRTRERYGQALELTAQLQESVPTSDCFVRFGERFENFCPGESTFRRATRHALMMLLVFGALILPPFVVQNRLHEWPIITASAVMVFCFTYLNKWMREALYGPAGRSWPRILLVAGAASLVIPGVAFGVCFIFSGEARSSIMSVLPLLPWAAGFIWVPVCLAASMAEKKLRYRREWDSLQVS